MCKLKKISSCADGHTFGLSVQIQWEDKVQCFLWKIGRILLQKTDSQRVAGNVGRLHLPREEFSRLGISFDAF